MADSWRVCIICTIRPIADTLAGALQHSSGTNRRTGHRAGRNPTRSRILRSPATAPAGVDFAKDKWSIERLPAPTSPT
jgi:hypothetical protein